MWGDLEIYHELYQLVSIKQTSILKFGVQKINSMIERALPYQS
jgi:hypothetical protein